MRWLFFCFTFTLVMGCGGDVPPQTGRDDKGKVGAEPVNVGGKAVTLAQLVAGLPEDILPKRSGDTLRIRKANDWLAKHAVGKRVEDRHVFETIWVQELGGKQCKVTAKSHGNTSSPRNWLPIPGVPRDEQYFIANWPVQFGSDPNSSFQDSRIVMERVDEVLAQRHSDLEMKPVIVAGRVDGIYFHPVMETPTLSIAISDVTITAAPPQDKKSEPK